MNKLLSLLGILLALNISAQDTLHHQLITIDNWDVAVYFPSNDTSGASVTVPLEGMQNSDAAAYALFVHPLTYRLYALLDTIYSDSKRSFFEVNPLNGETELIMELNDYFSSADITPDGRIFGILGNGTSNTPGAIYEIDLEAQTIDSVTVSRVPNGEPRSIMYYPPTDELWPIDGDAGKIYPIHMDTWAQNDTIQLDVIEEEIHGMYFRDDTMLVSDYSGYIWSIPVNFENDTLESTFIVDMPANVMDLTEVKLIASASERSICPNQIVPDSLFALYNSTSYQWYLNGEALLNDTLNRVAISTEGEYQLLTEIDSTGNMIFSEIITVTEGTVPNVTLNASTTLLCPGDEILITGTSGGTSQWYRNGDPILGATLNTYNATQTGVYNMIKTNQSGCSDSAAVGVTITAQEESLCEIVTVPTGNVLTEIAVYPTITSDYIWIETNANVSTIVNVYSITGSRMLNKTFAPDKKHIIDLSSLSKGLYILHITNGTQVKTERIIKE